MKLRTISAIFLLIILVGALVISSKVFGIIMMIVAVLGFNELFRIKYDKRKEIDIIKVLAMVCLVMMVLNNVFFSLDIKTLILIPLLVLSLPIIFYNNSKIYNIDDALYVIGIVYFLGLSIGNIIYLRSVNIEKCIYIFVVAFITDTFAYIGGSLIGRHKLTSISPKKTIEGTLVGTFMGVVIGTVYYFNVVGKTTVFNAVMLSFALTILSEMGDLLFSSIKRYFDKKDYSNLIPGHGGIIDRFDSIIYVSLGLSLILSLF